MKKLTDMTSRELLSWAITESRQFMDWSLTLATLRDGVVAECADKRAETEARKAREVAQWVLDYWQKNLTVHGSGMGADRMADGGQVGVFARKLRSWIEPEPPKVKLTDDSVVTYELDKPSNKMMFVRRGNGKLDAWWTDWRSCADNGEDFDILKPFAAKVGAR